VGKYVCFFNTLSRYKFGRALPSRISNKEAKIIEYWIAIYQSSEWVWLKKFYLNVADDETRNY